MLPARLRPVLLDIGHACSVFVVLVAVLLACVACWAVALWLVYAALVWVTN